MTAKIGFLGAGKMAHALAKGFITSGLTKAEELVASCPVEDEFCLEGFKNLGCGTTHKNNEVVERSDVVVVAVKPNVISRVLQGVRTSSSNDKLFISVAMGVGLIDIKNALHPSEPKIARVMPNTCVGVKHGASAFVTLDDASADIVTRLFSAVGSCHRLTDESQLDAVTGLSGSGPAYMLTIAEALADGGVKMGLPRKLAVQLASQTMLGVATMIQTTSQHTAVLRDEVTSPGGNTIEGLHFLEKSGLRAALIGAVEAGTEKCRRTNKELKEQLKIK